jgi:hypothetical protein
LLLSRIGMPVGAATLPVVVFRFCTLWLGSLIGLVFMLGWLYFTSRGNARVPGGDPDGPLTRPARFGPPGMQPVLQGLGEQEP